MQVIFEVFKEAAQHKHVVDMLTIVSNSRGNRCKGKPGIT